MYRAMAERERETAVAEVYRRLGAIEEKHAAFWEERLRRVNHPRSGAAADGAGPRAQAGSPGGWGRGVLPTVASSEYTHRNDYLAHPETKGTGMTDEERMHARVLDQVLPRSSGMSGSSVARIEGRHRNVGGNALRAAVLGSQRRPLLESQPGDGRGGRDRRPAHGVAVGGGGAAGGGAVDGARRVGQRDERARAGRTRDANRKREVGGEPGGGAGGDSSSSTRRRG